MRWLGKLERPLLILGLLLLGIYLGARVHGFLLSQAAVQRFKNPASVVVKPTPGTGLVTKAPDFSLWSEKRIRDYQESLAAHFSPAIAVLRIPNIDLQVPVLEGTDDLSLNRGVGLIAGTSRPGEAGNIGIAGHRDGFFRGLKDVTFGDEIEITTQDETIRYAIDRIVIVEPSDVSVLAPRQDPSVTLVTCYPFYFVGSAPKRYIVQAHAVSANLKGLRSGGKASAEIGKIGRQDSTE